MYSELSNIDLAAWAVATEILEGVIPVDMAMELAGRGYSVEMHDAAVQFYKTTREWIETYPTEEERNDVDAAMEKIIAELKQEIE